MVQCPYIGAANTRKLEVTLAAVEYTRNKGEGGQPSVRCEAGRENYWNQASNNRPSDRDGGFQYRISNWMGHLSLWHG